MQAQKLGLENESDQQNWMTQAAERTRMGAQTQQTQAQTAQMQAMAPAIQAKSQAEILAAGNMIAQSTAQQQARSVAAPLATQANDDFLSIMGMNSDPTKNIQYPAGGADEGGISEADIHLDRMNRLAGLQARVSGLEMVPEQKHIYDMIESSKKNEADMYGKQLQMQAELQYRKYMADSMTQRAQIGAGARVESAGIAAGARTEAATTMAGARESGAEATVNSALIHQYGSAATALEAAAGKSLDSQEQASLMAESKKYRDQMEAVANKPAAGPATTKSTVTPAAKGPVKVKDWDEAKALGPGTSYIGPDGQAYVRSGSAP